MIYTGWAQSISPGNEQLDFWGSAAADRESSRNYAGIKDPAVDAIINDIILAKDRDDQVAAVHALDRVLMWNQYVIPSYTHPEGPHRLLGPFRPPRLQEAPLRHRLPDHWWWDAAKAAKIGRRAVRRLARGLTRRSALGGAAAHSPSTALKPFAWAAGRSGLHGLSIFGELKYGPDFKAFDYVNVDAPKGGRMNFQPSYWVYNQSTQTFNTLNSFVLKGDAPPRMEMTFDTLMASAEDEPNSYLRARRRDGGRFRRRQCLHLPSARRAALPRRLAADRRGRRLFADAAQGEGPPRHLAGDRADGRRRRRPTRARSW